MLTSQQTTKAFFGHAKNFSHYKRVGKKRKYAPHPRTVQNATSKHLNKSKTILNSWLTVFFLPIYI